MNDRYLVVGVRFKRAGKIYYFSPEDIEEELKSGNYVIVETSRGLEFGEIVIPPRELPEEELVFPLKKVIRKATPEDEAQMQENKRKEDEAFDTCLEKIEEHKLDMKLVDVEYNFDNSKVIFYFTADGRIDFRELVKDLASIFKTRIELRQIGVRDEAKILGGLGPCGRPLCCASFLGEFEPVSIKMAKEQNLSLNPAKISGICGRLMCCLKYESETYEMAKEDFPGEGAKVSTMDGQGEVVGVNIIKGTVHVEMNDTHKLNEYELDDLEIIEDAPKEQIDDEDLEKDIIEDDDLT
ncbi:PSP1 domain-containing protein [Natranaerofaba carboxydovora]|uniref:PSP1 domain-containing protein n=1 Tax=Natranaerofaba carboxydovora TaxID=2742683 RepID=UPI001F13E3F7|nr:stage 0 sporulation family protein [Natranaerofaba carboxydovora]UMZ75243.1 hypothetical protein ACONDI_02862 [Natranaerofaba carboxydovora]